MKGDTAGNVSERGLEIIRTFSDAWQRGDLAVAGSFLADDVEWYDQAAIPGADLHRGPEAVRRHWQQWLEPWREVDYAMEELLDYGDRFVLVVNRRGKGKASGAEVADEVIYLITIRGDKIVRFEGFSEKADALEAAALKK